MKTILLTGSGGFIGKNLKNYLQDKYVLLTPRSFELDLTHESTVQKYFEQNKIDFIIHCGSTGGARGINDKDTTIENNLAMVENLISAKNPQVRMILFASGAMYDKSRPLKKINEDEIGKVVPSDLYGKSKMLIAQKIAKRDDVLCFNIFGCYGYGEKENRFPSYAISQNIKKEPIEINQNVVFDYLFVEDMQKIVAYFIENKPTQNIINITPTKSISLLEIAQIVNANSDFKSEIIIKNPIMNNEYTGDNKKLLDEYKDFTFTEYETGLKKLKDFIASDI